MCASWYWRVISIGRNATASASSQKTESVWSSGSITVGEGATLTGASAGKGAGIYCYGALINEGATVNGEIDAIGGIYNKSAD